MSDLVDRAESTLARHLAGNPYPGRGLVLGRSADGQAWLQLYWIMGRSANSRNRVFVGAGSTLRTEPFDASAVEDPSLILYDAMLELERVYVVSNGDQTRTVHDALAKGGTFEAALATREREPDAPNFTPRITGLIDLRSARPAFALSLLKANRADPERTDRTTFRPAPPPPGLGVGLTTYQGDGAPLPAFEGEPLWLPLAGAPEAVLARYWEALDRENRVSLAVKRIPLAGGPGTLLVRNRHTR
jgi:IMP cyclohydrolase